MISTVTLNPSIDREYFVEEHQARSNQFIYDKSDLKVYPGGKGLLTAINLKNLGYPDVQNIGFIGGKQGLFFEKMVQEYRVTTNYIYTNHEIRNNIKIITRNPVSITHYNDYTYRVQDKNVTRLFKRFRRSIGDSELVMICGSIPAGVDFEIYHQLINICNEQEKDVYLEASGAALNKALAAEPKFVVPYFKHTKKILEKEVKDFDDYIEAGRKLQAEGAKYVILPFHCDRLLFTPEGRIFSLTPEDYCFRNLLGAGDAFNAAFYDYIHYNGFDFLEANRYAGAAALAVAEAKMVFINSRDEIEENLHRLIIEEVEV